MSETQKLNDRNAAIQAMMTSSDGLMNFYRFVAQNPHIPLREACQIIVERPNASVCFSFEEWNAMDRRVNKGGKGIPYIDSDGQKRFVFDGNDTHGDGRYRRLIYPMKRLLKGLDVLNGTSLSEDFRGDYRKIKVGVASFLNENDYFGDDEERNKLLLDGVAYFLYCKTGFPKNNGIPFAGLPYNLHDNAAFFMNVKEIAEHLQQEVEQAYQEDLNKVEVIDDTEEETVSDEPVLPPRTEKVKEEPKPVEPVKPQAEEKPVSPLYQRYMDVQEQFPKAVVVCRVGDFYEVFGENAKTIGEELDLTLTSRNFGLPERVPMIGFPFHVADQYISKIVEKRGVVLLEQDEEPKYILSRAEVLGQEEKSRPTLEPVDDDELPFDFDDEEDPDKESGFFEADDDDNEITDEDWAEAAEYLNGENRGDSEEKPAQGETDIQPQKKEKSIRERKRKEKPQLSLFDLMDENGNEVPQDPRENLIKRVLCGGSSFANGKFRILERYETNPTIKEFAVFLKDEYGTGGSYSDGLDTDHDSKGIRAKYTDKEHPENNTDFLLNWNEVANKIADFIDDGEYLTSEQQEEYKQYLAERTGEPAERNKAIVDHIIRDIRHRDARGYYRFFGSSLYADYFYIHEHADEINEEILKRDGISDAYFRGDDFYVYGRALDEKTGFADSASDILERKQELLEAAKHGYNGIRIKTYAEYLFFEGTTSTNTGNWVFYFDEFGEEEAFVRENAAEIGKELCLSKGVESLSIDDDCIDVNFYTDFCPQVSDESDETNARKSREKSRFNRFKELTAEDRAFVENYSMRSGYAPTYSMWGEVQDSVAIANGIYSVSTASHGGFMVGAELAQHILSPEALKAGQFENGYYCYEEDCDKNIAIRELYDKGILTQDNQYFTRSFVRPDGENGGYKPFTSLSDEEKEQFFKEWNKTVDESLAYWNKEYWQAHEGKLPIADKPSEEPEREEPQKAENTDLNEIGFDQSELGGAKARFQANLEAIRLLNQLDDEDRFPTKSERLVLAKYVGWGGLAKVFDEHDPNWSKEYNELKSALTFEDYDRAKASVLNAHYTSKEVIEGIYKALSEMGVKGNNRILEPAMGTGNFFGFMPKEIADGARLYGVELDSITGRIAQKLYPNANIQVKGFEQTSFSNNRFDIVVGNVPFGAYTVYDSEYAKHNFYIHDYFLAKSIDKLKPNGLMAVITSTGTMDKLNPSVRKYLAERAELLGAIRLPNTAFKQNAGTEVVADILFFRKRENLAYVHTDNTEWLATGKTEKGYEINNYFIQHPEMVLGTLTEERGLYGALDVTVKPDDRTITEALSDAISRLPKDIYLNPTHKEELRDEISVDYNIKPLCYKAENGKLFMRVGDEMVEQEIPKSPKDAYERICEMITLRNELRYVLEIQTEGCSDEKLQSEQRILNANYDHFVKRFGYLNSQTNTRLFRDDADSALLFACEDVSEDKSTVTKAEIFSKRTIRPYVAVTSTDDCFEALQISKNERGQVDISYIEELTGKDYDTVLKELDNAVFRIPAAYEAEDKYTGFVTAEEYLSGNVVKKLEKAKRYAEVEDKAFEKNVKALEAVQPTPIPASDIGVRIGASWIDTDYYKQFLYHLLQLPTYYDDGIEIYYNHFDSSWRVDKKNYFRYWSQENANEVYGTSRANAYRLFEDCLNLRATTIYDTVENSDGSQRRVLNQAETIAAREKQNKIKEAFVDWIFSDPERREQLEKTYNSTFNQTRLPTYDGSYLRFPGMNPAIELKPHQKDAVHRIVSTGKNTLLHHVVGSGKTFTMFAAGMKLRQYGLAKKIMYAVPNHLVEQWAAEGRKLYPNAKILVATKEDLAKDKRQRFVSKVAMGDWDAIIIAQSSFAKIPISPERQIRKIQEEIQRIEETIEATWMDKGMPRGAVKNLEKIKKSREAQLKKLLDDDKKDNVLIFENLGVDYLFIDEAHYYKNKFLFTKMNNVAGISTTASQRASDLELKVEYINELHGGDKGVVFATGTPISNSMTEMYTMQSYLQRNELANIGITFFDQWAANFGETVTSLEMAPSGQGYKARTRFSKFTNLPELLTMYRSFADVQTQDMVKLDVPDVDRKVITLKPSDTVLELADEIAKRAEDISKGGIPPEIDNMLKVTSDGKKLALDPRCFDRTSTDEEGSKINECASRIFEIWEDTADIKGTQIVFCDLSTPKKAFDDYEYGKDFDVYNDLKYKLVQMGIPKEEIAYIHDANGDKAKQSLFDKVNAGAVRVLIGSTEKCGAGTNVQERLIALHHLDTPYRPSDMQQREGRIIRQGNTNKEVQIYTYVTERTFDSYSYQILENKQKFISQIDRGDLTVREAEDIDERTLNYAEIKAITAANPKIKRKMEVDTEIARLRVLEGQYKKNLFALQDKIRKTYPEDIKRQTLYLERLRADIATIKEKYDPEAFSINVQGKTYTDKKEGGQALMDALFHNPTETVVAEYGGMKISLEPLVMIASERSVSLTGAGKYSMEIGQSASGLITRLDNFLEAFPEREARAESKLSQLQSDLKVAESQVGRPFEHKDTLAALVKEQAELNAELDLNKREEVVIDEEKDDTVVSVDSDEVAMGVPESHYNRKERKKPRKHLTEQISKTYNKVKGEEPDAYVFLRNGSNYEIYGEQARELADKYELPTITDTVSGQEEVVLSVDYRELDTLIRDVIGNGNKAKIIEETFEKEETFIDSEDQIAAMQVAVLPDYSIGQEEMHKYGYTWDGMLPLRKNAAKLLFEVGLPVKYLHGTDSEEAVDNTDDIVYRSGLFGIEKPEWQAFCESDKGFAYLYARHFFSESVLKTLNEDMSYIDGRFVDGLSDAVYEENAALKAYLPDDKIPVDEQMKPFVKSLLDFFVARFEYFPLEHYGWNKNNVYASIAENLADKGLKEEAQRILKGENMEETEESKTSGLPKNFEKLDYRAYSQEQGYGLTDRETRLWINAYKDGTEEQRAWIIGFFENINYHYETGLLLQEKYDELEDEYPSSLLNNNDEMDENSEEGTGEYKSGVEPPVDYKEAVIERVEKEYDEFRDKLITEPALNVFHRNYEIHVKTELMEVITDGDGYLDEDDYKALYREKDGLLQLMYDDFTHNEFASVNNFGDTAEFIKNYIDYYLKGKMIYYGKDTENTAYYRLIDGHLSRDSLSEITEKADDYVIAAPALAMSQEEMKKHHIFFLKTDRDIPVSELEDEKHAIGNMQKAVYNVQHQRAEEYRRNMRGNVDCKQAIEQAISENFDGAHLKDGFEHALIERFGFDRVKYVLSNTVQMKSDDGRFSATNKEWARETEITELEAHRYQFIVESHPAVLDGFIKRVRSLEKQKSVNESINGEFLSKTKDGYAVVNITKDVDDRNIAIVYRPNVNDYVVAARYDVNDGTWGQGIYVSTLDQAEKYRKEHYGESPYIYENKEWKTETMAEENKKKWITVLTAKDALIKKYEKSSLMRMPTTGEYAGYTYFLFNDRIKDAYQTTDIQSDSRELAYSLRLGEKETVLIKNLEEDKEVELTVEQFENLVGNKTSSDYARQGENGQTRWTTVNVPSEAMLGHYENSSLFVLPNQSQVKGSFYVPNAFVSEDTESDDERFRISVPDDFTFTVKNRKNGESVKLSAYQLFRAMNNTQAADYERQPQEKTESPKTENTDGWKYVSVSNSAFITEYSERDMFRMPQGEYAGYCYYIPRGLLRYNEEKETVRISLPEGFVVSLFNKNAAKEEEKKIEMSADDFIAQVKGKTAEDYEQYQKPSESKKEAFAIMEKQLRERVPEEMLNKPNWVVVRTKENAENGRLEKYLIDVHTGKFAESDNPATWTTFDDAARYAKENGGVTLAYALDGKDGICCIDLDHCYDEHGNLSALAEQIKSATQGTYREISVSGKGLHFFGKTKGMDVKAFSKDGKSEFYQKAHFIAMTGNTLGDKELMDFDALPVKNYLLEHHDKRTVLVGAGKGVEGLSSMFDRDVVEKAMASKNGDVFKALYSGQDLQNNHSNSDMSLMNRLAFWCNGDKEQMLRIFATSGLYRENKSPDYYEGTAIKAIRDTSSRFQPKAPTSAGNKPVGNDSGKEGK